MNHDIVIVGAGFGGLGMGMQLKRRGRSDFVILEQDTGVGGTWHANRYPGAACDIPSLLYSFSFAPSTGWTSRCRGPVPGCWSSTRWSKSWTPSSSRTTRCWSRTAVSR